MSGTTTINGSSVMSQFTPGTSASVAFNAITASGAMFSVDTTSGAFGTAGPVSVGGMNITATFANATIVYSTAISSSLTVTTLPSAKVFAASGDTITAAGADTLYGADTGLSTFISTGNNSSVVGGAGDMAATASGANTTLIGGTGTSNFTVSGAGSVAVAGPSGTTNISLTDSAGAEVATNPLGNSGSLVASLSQTGGADTVAGGSGSSSIVGGNGHDVFAFVAGHGGGSETISGFTSNDTFAFSSDYGYSLKNPPPEAVVNGNDVITLTDGTEITTITIINHGKIF